MHHYSKCKNASSTEKGQKKKERTSLEHLKTGPETSCQLHEALAGDSLKCKPYLISGTSTGLLHTANSEG